MFITDRNKIILTKHLSGNDSKGCLDKSALIWSDFSRLPNLSTVRHF